MLSKITVNCKQGLEAAAYFLTGFIYCARCFKTADSLGSGDERVGLRYFSTSTSNLASSSPEMRKGKISSSGRSSLGVSLPTAKGARATLKYGLREQFTMTRSASSQK